MKQKLVALFLMIVMVASALTVVGLATTAAAAPQRTVTTLNLKTLNTGSKYTFYGALGVGTDKSPRIPNAKITLLVSSDNAHWRIAWASTKTNAAGDYAFHLTLKQGHTYYFRTYYAGSSTYREAFSPIVKVRAA